MKLRANNKGFTIVEVVLVLAIAGLIFLIVFLALPQLQRSRRDTQRKSDGGRIVAALESFASNNNGVYPTSGTQQTDFTSNYINDILNPSGSAYGTVWGGTVAPALDSLRINVQAGADCAGGSLAAREVAVRVGLEDGTYCQDNK